MNCANVSCNKQVSGSYSTHRVNAVEQHFDCAPDGGSISTVAEAIVTCSWPCMRTVLDNRYSPYDPTGSDEQPF